MKAQTKSVSSMELDYIVRHLEPDEVHLVYPLLRATGSNLALEDWMGYADHVFNSAGERGAGVVGVQTVHGYFHGFFTYRTERDLRCGWTLVVDNFVVADLLNKPAAQVLVDEMERIAADRGYKAVHIDFRGMEGVEASRGQEGAAAHFPGAGYDTESVRLCKRLL